MRKVDWENYDRIGAEFGTTTAAEPIQKALAACPTREVLQSIVKNADLDFIVRNWAYNSLKILTGINPEV